MPLSSPISVALASYNGALYLREQLDSIFAQSHPVAEIVICDDGSTDGTRELLQEIAANEPKIKLHFNSERLGFRDNFFKAISLCSSPIIALSDQDDIWFPDKIERLLPLLQTADLACSDLVAVDQNGAVITPSVFRLEKRRLSTGLQFAPLLYSSFVTGCTTLFKKELLDTLPGNGERYHDWWLAVLASRQNGIAVLQEPTVYYRQHGKNDTGIRSAHLRLASLLSFGKRVVQKRSRSGRYRDAERQVARLTDLLLHPAFSAEEKRSIAIALQYYKSYLSSPLHLRASWIGLRHRSVVHGKLSPLDHLIRTLSDTVG